MDVGWSWSWSRSLSRSRSRFVNEEASFKLLLYVEIHVKSELISRPYICKMKTGFLRANIRKMK